MQFLITVAGMVLASLTQTGPATAASLQVLKVAAPGVEWVEKSVVVGDIDCDGHPDAAFLGRKPGHAFLGLVRAGQTKPEILSFPIDPAKQAATCGEPARLQVESLDYDPSEGVGPIEGFERSQSCKGLTLSGGECDAIHLFWNRKTRRLDWWRL